MQPTDSDFMRELMTVFCGEADERLTAIDQRLLGIEQTADRDLRSELFADLMRELHTLKGSAGAVNLPDVSRLAHALETHFGVAATQPDIAQDIYDRGYGGLDAMRALILAGQRGERAEVDVEAVLAAIAGGTPAPVAADVAETTTRPESVEAPAAAAERPFEPADSPYAVPPSPRADAFLHNVPWSPATAAPPAASPVGSVASAPAHPPVAAVATVVAPPSAPTARVPQRADGGADEVVRLSTAKLDSLMARVGELVVTRIGTGRRTTEVRALEEVVSAWQDTWRRVRPQYQKVAAALRDDTATANDLLPELRRLLPALAQNDQRLHELSRQVAELRSGIETDERRLGQVTTDIEDEVRRTRMLPVSTVFDPLHRMVRDLARDLGKEVQLEVEGGDTEVDRSVLEHIRSPLTHLIRNAVDHGVETPDVREAGGKARRATLRLAAAQRGGSLLLAMSDDGAGIDVGQVRETAVRGGLVSDDQLRVMSERDILRLVFRPNFSTMATVSDVSGRGVGLDVVRETVERLNGMVDVASEFGAGTTFTLSLPLSVATTQALLIEISGMTYALPIGAVTRIVSAARKDIGRAQGREMIVLDDGPVVLVRLEDVLQLPSDEEAHGVRRPVVIVGSEERRLGVAVDQLLGTQDVVVKPLPKPFERVRHAAGATVLASGEVVVVLNTSDLVRSAVRTAARVDRLVERPGGPGANAPGSASARMGTVMVVDDSIVTRMLEKSILEAAGYAVHVAADGVEALRSLHLSPVDLVVSDVNMPNMDGLALTQQIRADVQLRDTPIVLVTSLDAPDDHARGMEAGADAYIVKSSFSQEGLLETVRRLVTANGSRNGQRPRR